MKKSDLIKIFSLLSLVAIAYIPTFRWMIDRWSAKDTYYSHGFLVPFISAFIIWQKRGELGKLIIKPVNSGWWIFMFGLFLHAISTAFRVSFSSGFSLIIVLTGLILITLGKDFLKKLAFPVCFLISMIPLPLALIASMSFKLKIFAAQASTILMNKIGIATIRQGSILRTAHATLMVEDPCSGIRSLVALISLGALAAYFSNLSRPRKTILFLSSIPIAVTTNIIRITALGLVSEIYGEKYATGIFHDTMGILVFVFAFLGLMLVQRLLE
jgi:exosortase